MAIMSLRSRSHVKASMVLTIADYLFIHNYIRLYIYIYILIVISRPKYIPEVNIATIPGLIPLVVLG